MLSKIVCTAVSAIVAGPAATADYFCFADVQSLAPKSASAGFAAIAN
jgi:hypothetical protein